MKKLIAYFRELIRGRVYLQRFFLFLYKTSLVGMNFSGGAVVKNSGEANVVDYVSKKLPNGIALVIFDVGAHLGDYSNMLLEHLKNRKIQIHAFEPSNTTFQKLKINLAGKKVLLHNLGFSNEAKKMSLFYDYQTSVYASVYQRKLDHENRVMNISETIELTTIDDFCRQHNVSHIHFLKMDIEGHEFFALQGAKEMIKKNIDFIQFEFSAANIDSRTYFKDFYYLLSENYNIYRVLRDGLCPLKNYNETQEVFFTTNYLAERKSK